MDAAAVLIAPKNEHTSKWPIVFFLLVPYVSEIHNIITKTKLYSYHCGTLLELVLNFLKSVFGCLLSCSYLVSIKGNKTIDVYIVLYFYFLKCLSYLA